jgi:hypothetical protein
VFKPEDNGYDQEHRSLNHTLEHRPELIVGARCADDVRLAVGYAVERVCPLECSQLGTKPEFS